MSLKWFSKSKENATSESFQDLGAPLAKHSKNFEGWQFLNDQIYLHGKTIGEVINLNQHQPASFFSQLAQDLRDFQNYVILNRTKRNWWKLKKAKRANIADIDPTGNLGKLAGLVEAYIGKISRILRSKYNDAQTGLTLTIDEDGYLILNGMNVDNFLNTTMNFPNEKSFIFLKGLKNRLYQVLSSKSQSPSYSKYADRVQKTVDRIDEMMKEFEK